MNLGKTKRHPITHLNDYDRKILGKYTKFYTNFIESSTVQPNMPDEESANTKTRH